MSETLSSHDHGNCELCDHLEAEVAWLRAALTALAMKWRGEADTWQRGIGDNQNTRLYREVAGEVDALAGDGGPTR